MNEPIDTGKMQALFLAGWSDWMIAMEMGVSEEFVRAILDKIAEYNRAVAKIQAEYDEMRGG